MIPQVMRIAAGVLLAATVSVSLAEVDGEHHDTEEGREHDEVRDRYLTERGYTLLRIPGYQVLRDPAGARSLIENAIDQRLEQLVPLTPGPSPPSKSRGRGEPE